MGDAKAEHFRCKDCKWVHARADEDGCCSMCGTECVTEPCTCGSGQMKVFTWCPARAIPNCTHWFGEKHAHVIISTPGDGEAPAPIPACKENRILALKFHDLGEKFLNDLKYRDMLFTEAHAKAIAAFVKETPNEVLIVINCDGGVSRSAGVVLALRRFYGGDTEEPFERGVPNIFVTSILTRALGGQPYES